MSKNKKDNIKRLRDHFGLAAGDDFVWASRINSKKSMKKACNDPDVMLIESDVQHDLLSGKPFMIHPPPWTSDLSFETWMEMAIAADKGMKIDFKSPDVIDEIIEIYEKKMKDGKLKLPVFLNADILKGPGGWSPMIDPVEFIKKAKKLDPNAILSLGWTTSGGISKGPQYTREMMDEMINLIKKHAGGTSYTLCIRASYVKDSIENLQYLLKKLPDAHFTIWGHSSSANVTPEDLEWMKNRLDPARVSFDLIGHKKSGLAGIFQGVSEIAKGAAAVIKETTLHPRLLLKHAANASMYYKIVRKQFSPDLGLKLIAT